MPYIVLFHSRNKDNQHLPGFKQRTHQFLVDEINPNALQYKFANFVNDGRPFELNRLYVSVNNRSNSKTINEYMKYMIDHQDMSITKLQSKLTSIAAKNENAKTHHWLLDFETKLSPEEIKANIDITSIIEMYYTLSGTHIIVKNGFDTRKLTNKFKDNLEIKKDDLKLLGWQYTKDPTSPFNEEFEPVQKIN